MKNLIQAIIGEDNVIKLIEFKNRNKKILPETDHDTLK